MEKTIHTKIRILKNTLVQKQTEKIHFEKQIKTLEATIALLSMNRLKIKQHWINSYRIEKFINQISSKIDSIKRDIELNSERLHFYVRMMKKNIISAKTYAHIRN